MRVMTAIQDTDAPGGTDAPESSQPAVTLTLSVKADELLGLSALMELQNAAGEGRADVVSTAGTLMRMALAAKLDEAGLPWAPSPEDVRRRAAEAAEPDGAWHRLARNQQAKRYTFSLLAVTALTVLWGGYIKGWQWTGFRANDQLWEWLHLLLLPIVVGTIPLWIRKGTYISRARRVTYGAAVAAFGVFVVAGYLIPLRWTGFAGNTLWNWFGLILLPAAVASLCAWPSAGRSLRRSHKTAIVLLVAGWLITVIGGYALRWTWTGYQGNKLWDWLQLLLLPLLIPTILLPAVARLISGNAAGRAEEARAAGRAKAARAAAGPPRAAGRGGPRR
jgi:hypothetical protein